MPASRVDVQPGYDPCSSPEDTRAKNALRALNGTEAALERQSMKRERMIRFLEERNLASCANDTKWREFLSAVLHYRLASRVKAINDEPSEWAPWLLPVETCFENTRFGPIPFRLIEWIEFELPAGSGAAWDRDCNLMAMAVVAAAHDARIDHVVDGTTLRVYGYRQIPGAGHRAGESG